MAVVTKNVRFIWVVGALDCALAWSGCRQDRCSAQHRGDVFSNQSPQPPQKTATNERDDRFRRTFASFPVPRAEDLDVCEAYIRAQLEWYKHVGRRRVFVRLGKNDPPTSFIVRFRDYHLEMQAASRNPGRSWSLVVHGVKRTGPKEAQVLGTLSVPGTQLDTGEATRGSVTTQVTTFIHTGGSWAVKETRVVSHAQTMHRGDFLREYRRSEGQGAAE